MIGFYALGGGFGHVTRVATFIRNQKIKSAFKVITNNPNAYRFFTEGKIIFLDKSEIENKERLQHSIRKQLERYIFSEFYIDVFPSGILGELSSHLFNDIPVHLLARRLQWKNYRPYLTSKAHGFQNVFVFEPLEPEHRAFLKAQAQKMVITRLSYVNQSTSNEQIEKLKALQKPLWLIVHTSNTEELEVLWQYAQDIAAIENVVPHWIVLSEQQLTLPSEVSHFTEENPVDWFPHVSKIFSAAGFNTVQQLKPYGDKSILFPFPRKFDDQFWRAREFKKSTF